MAAKFIVVSNVLKLAHKHGRRVSPGYLGWLDREILRRVQRDCAVLRGTKTLRAADAAALAGTAR